MIELKPPAVMPNGNIGTPSQYFLEQIRLCRLPASVITKLGIQTQKRKKKFGEVPFEYEKPPEPKTNPKYDTIGNVADEPEDPTERLRKQQNPEDNDGGKDDDDDQCEEWERHEALHDDVTEQDRTKPKKYEEEMEVTWEKGGPGLVWYTDKNYWDEQEKGMEMRTEQLSLVQFRNRLRLGMGWRLGRWLLGLLWRQVVGRYGCKGSRWNEKRWSAAVGTPMIGFFVQLFHVFRAGKMEVSVFTKKATMCPPMGNRRKRRHSEGDATVEKATENLHRGVGGIMLAKWDWI